MKSLKEFIDFGVLPIRVSSRRSLRPHLSLIFRAESKITVGIDTTEGRTPINDFLLITHAHRDHYGHRVMKFEHTIASRETAKALEIISRESFRGRCFEIGDEITENGWKIRTYETFHTPGSTAFYWKNDIGTRILVTGDVKEFKELPKCDLLITEATYGDPQDPSCYFEDDVEGFLNVSDESPAFGAYPFGKAQRAVRLLRESGFSDIIQMDGLSFSLTRAIIGDEEIELLKDDESLKIVSPKELKRVRNRKKFVLSAQKFYRSTITLSDHADFRNLLLMIERCDPELVILYHGGRRAERMRDYLRNSGYFAISLKDVNTIIGDPNDLVEGISRDI